MCNLKLLKEPFFTTTTNRQCITQKKYLTDSFYLPTTFISVRNLNFITKGLRTIIVSYVTILHEVFFMLMAVHNCHLVFSI